MLIELIFATNNPHKIKELQNLLGDKFRLLSLEDIGCYDEIPEKHPTLEKNASAKAFYIFHKFRNNCFADDTGLEIEALNGEPGVFSARYAGMEKIFSSKEETYKANVQKVLKKLEGVNYRKARFRTVISFIENGKETRFEGIVNGTILKAKRGTGGFGYDPIFKPDGYKKTFAEMSLNEKNKISHRGIAVKKLVNYLLNR